MRVLSCAIAMILLVACGSSAGDDSDVNRAAQAADLLLRWEGENYTNPSLLPTDGRFEFDGLATIALPINGERNDLIGDVHVTVNFGRPHNPINGEISNIGALGGQLNISGGAIDRSADPETTFTFGANLAGALTSGVDVMTVEGGLDGDFRGRNQDGMTGLIHGTVEGLLGRDIFDGTFAASQIDN